MIQRTLLFLLLSTPFLFASEVFRHYGPKNSDITGVASAPNGTGYACGILEKPAQLPGPLRRFHAGGQGYHGFVTKLNANGSPAFSAAFAGGYTLPGNVAVAPNGDVIVAGLTTDPNFPVRHALQPSLSGEYDVFVIRFDSELREIRFATYLGGASYDSTSALALDQEGNTYVAVSTRGAGFLETNLFELGPRNSGAVTALLKLSPDGELIYGSRLNSFTTASVFAMAVDSEQHVHVAGATYDGLIPTVNAAQPFPSASSGDAFVAKFTPDGRDLVFSTYLGGSCGDSARALVIKPDGEILIGGDTCSEVFPATVDEGSASSSLPPSRGFVARYSASGQRLEMQMLDYSGRDAVTALALDSSGKVVLGGNIGSLSGYPAGSGIPFVASVENDKPIVSRALVERCSPSANLVSMATSGKDILFVGHERPENAPPYRRSFVSKVTSPSGQPSATTVALLNPDAGSVFAPRQPIYLSAAAYGGSGAVTAVTFFNGDTVIGTVTNTPYALYWSNAVAGTHSFSAAAEIDGEIVRSCTAPVTLGSPANDKFENRTRLRGELINVPGRMAGATAGPHEYQFLISVWWEWVAPRSGAFKFRIPDVGGGYQFQAFTGSQPADLQPVGYGYGTEMVLRVERGVTYQISVITYPSDSLPDFRLLISPVQAPPNDNFAQAQVITGADVFMKGTLRNASPELAQGGFGSDVWYSWTAPTSGPFFAWAESETQSLKVQVLTFNPLGYFEATGQSVYSSTNGQTFETQAGQTHHIRISTHEPGSKFTLHLRPQPAPPNDEFVNATEVFTSQPIKAGTVGATWNVGETTSGFSPAIAWWKWTAPSSGVYRIEAPLTPLVLRRTLPSGIGGSPISPSSRVQVFTGNSLPGLTSILSTDNYQAGKFRALAGETYSIAINTGLTEFTLSITPVPSPANDAFADAILLSGTNIGVTAQILNATLEPGEPLMGSFPYFGSEGSVWYRWIAPEDGVYSFAASGRASLVVYLGSELSSLQALTGFLNRSAIRVSAGEAFSIAVSLSYFSTAFDVATFQIQRVAPPANDDFANPEMLTGLPVSFIPRTRNATLESNEPEATSNPRRVPSTVWYTWTAPTTGRFELTQDGYDTLAYAYGGSTLETLQGLGTEFDLLEGETVQISVSSQGGNTAPAVYTLRQIFPPPNDNFAARLSITGALVSVVGTTRNATREMFESGAVGESTVWYSWTAPRSGRVVMEVSFADSSTFLAVFTGGDLSMLNPVAPNEQNRSAEVSVEAGETYQIVVGEHNFGSGDFGLTIRYLDTPAGDNITHAALVKHNRARGTTIGASLEADEPLGEYDEFAASVWWIWTAPRTAVYQVELRTFAELLVNVFSGSDIPSLESVLIDEDLPPRFAATKGQSYLIQLLTPNGGGGDYDFEIVRIRPPSNDDFAHRAALRGNDLRVRANNRFASIEDIEPGDIDEPPRRSLWWSWTAPSDGTIFLDRVDTQQRMALYRGDQLEELDYVDLNVSENGLTATVEAGAQYQIVVNAAADYLPGNPVVDFRLRFIGAPVNDRFENRLTLTEAPIRTTGTVVGASGANDDVEWYDPHVIWWRWIVPETGRYTVAVRATNAWPVLNVFRGDQRENLEFLDQAFGGDIIAQLNLPFVAGEIITLRVGAEIVSINDTVGLSIYPTQPPANDDFANRLPLVNGRGIGANEGASREESEPGFADDPLGASVWWRYTPPASGWVRVTTQITETNVSVFPSSILPQVRIYEGDSLSALTELPAFYSRRPGPPRYLFQSGVDYAIELSDPLHRLGQLEMFVEFMLAPPNDHFTNATVLTGDVWQTTGSNYWATLEPEESLSGEGTSSVWWQWTAAASGRYELVLGSFSGIVGVYLGNSVTNLNLVTSAGSSFEGSFFQVEAGETYRFAFFTPVEYETSVQFEVRRADPPVNDDFVNRALLVGSHASVVASNYFATREPNDPSQPWYRKSVWWKWAAPASEPVTLSMSNNPYNFFGAVFTGNALGSLVPVADFQYFPFTINAVAGTEYAIEVNGYSPYSTQFTLGLDQTNAPAASQRSLSLPVSVGSPRVIETSTDLVHWVPVQTSTVGKTNFVIAPNVNDPQRFFRVR